MTNSVRRVMVCAAALWLVAACKGDSKGDGDKAAGEPAKAETKPGDDPADNAADKSGDGPADTSGDSTAATEEVDSAGTTTSTGAPKFTTAQMCADPCLRLVGEPVDQLMWDETDNGFCKGCGKDCKPPKLECGEHDEYRNCIYAAHGYQFTKKKWQDKFASKSWYNKNPAFKDSMMSRVASDNVATLKFEARACAPESKYEQFKKTKEFAVDFDGDGKPEKVTVEDKVVKFGSDRVPHMGAIDDAAIAVPSKKNKRQVLLLRMYDSEDYYQHQVVSLVKGKLKVSKKVGAGGIELPGDGKFVDLSGNCGQRYWTEYALANGELKKVKNVTIGKHNEAECAACPFVYIKDDSGERYVGEILRDLRTPAQAATQSLRLPALPSGPVSIVVTEEKDEVTYLDAIYATVDGDRVVPVQCTSNSGARPAYCDADGRMFVLRQGDRLELSFEPTAGAGSVDHVWATGFYIPN